MPAPVILATLAVTVQTAWRALQAPRRPCLGTLRVLRTRAQAISSARRGRLILQQCAGRTPLVLYQ